MLNLLIGILERKLEQHIIQPCLLYNLVGCNDCILRRWSFSVRTPSCLPHVASMGRTGQKTVPRAGQKECSHLIEKHPFLIWHRLKLTLLSTLSPFQSELSKNNNGKGHWLWGSTVSRAPGECWMQDANQRRGGVVALSDSGGRTQGTGPLPPPSSGTVNNKRHHDWNTGKQGCQGSHVWLTPRVGSELSVTLSADLSCGWNKRHLRQPFWWPTLTRFHERNSVLVSRSDLLDRPVLEPTFGHFPGNYEFWSSSESSWPQMQDRDLENFWKRRNGVPSTRGLDLGSGHLAQTVL